MYEVEQEGSIRGMAAELDKVIVGAVGHCRGPRLVSTWPPLPSTNPIPSLTLHPLVHELLPLVWISKVGMKSLLHQPE